MALSITIQPGQTLTVNGIRIAFDSRTKVAILDQGGEVIFPNRRAFVGPVEPVCFPVEDGE